MLCSLANSVWLSQRAHELGLGVFSPSAILFSAFDREILQQSIHPYFLSLSLLLCLAFHIFLFFFLYFSHALSYALQPSVCNKHVENTTLHQCFGMWALVTMRNRTVHVQTSVRLHYTAHRRGWCNYNPLELYSKGIWFESWTGWCLFPRFSLVPPAKRQDNIVTHPGDATCI